MKQNPIRARRVVGSALLVTSVAGLCFAQGARAEQLAVPSAPTASGALPEKTVALAARSSLRFESNRGQLEERVRFLARGKGFGLYLGREGATLALIRNKPSERHPAAGAIPSELEQAIVSMRVVGARSVEPIGE